MRRFVAQTSRTEVFDFSELSKYTTTYYLGTSAICSYVDSFEKPILSPRSHDHITGVKKKNVSSVFLKFGLNTDYLSATAHKPP